MNFTLIEKQTNKTKKPSTTNSLLVIWPLVALYPCSGWGSLSLLKVVLSAPAQVGALSLHLLRLGPCL